MANTEFFARHGLQVAPNTRFRLVTGNTAQRPVSPANGDVRFNTDLGAYEGYYSANTTWASLGGVVTTSNAQFDTLNLGNSTVNVFSNSTQLRVGANAVINSSSFQISNSIVSAILSCGTLTIGSNLTVNTSGWGVGNSTVSAVANSTHIGVGNTTINNISVKVGNSTVFTTTNSSIFSGTSLLANNAAYLGGILATQYAYANQITSATPGGSNTHIQYNLSGAFGASAGLTFNFNSNTMSVSNSINIGGATINSTSYSGAAASATNSTNLNGQAASYYLALGNHTGTLPSSGLSSGTNYVVNIVTASTYLYSSGNVFAVGDVYASYSDKRLKFDLIPIRSALDIVDEMTGYTYWQNELGDEVTGYRRKGRQVGLIAQDVERVLPEAVSIAPFDRDPNGFSISGEDYLTISYEKLVPVLVEAIKELRREIKELKG
jgi:hypothetical protein